MKKTWKQLVIGTLCIMTVAACIAGCGNQNSAKDAPKEAKKLLVGTNATYPPFEFTKEDQKVQGFDVDLMNAIAKKMGTEVEWKNMGFDGLIPAIEGGQLDAAIAGMNVTPEREKIISFSKPYYGAANVILHMKGDGINTIADLKGKKLAAQIATTGADLAHKVPGANVKEFNDVPDILNEMKTGGSQAAVVDGPVAAYYIKLNPGNFEAFKSGEKEAPIAIAVKKDNKELVDKINKALDELKADGTYKKLEEKWFGGLVVK